MSDLLLPELYQVILLKLPIKSLMKCTSVCKRWRSIVTSPAFISGHLSLSRQNPLLLTNSTTEPHTFALHLDTDPPLRLSQTLQRGDGPFRLRLSQTLHRGDGPFRVVGSVDGLVLLSDEHCRHTYTTILWNPSIRKSFTLPKPRFNYDEVGPNTSMLGFGADPVSNDYKVVRLVYLYVSYPKVPPLAEVFSLRDRSWRTVSSTNVNYLLPDTFWSQCFIHGALHWIGRKVGEGTDTSIIERGILLFDLGKEEFKKMALPEDANAVPSLDYSIAVIGGMLSVFFKHVNLNVCVKRDYFADSWTKMLSLDIRTPRLGVVLYLRGFCGAGDRRDIQVPSKLRRDGFVFSYTESLVGEELEKTRLGT